MLKQEAYKYNAESLENKITALRLEPDFNWQVDKNTAFLATFPWGSYNDGNTDQQLFVQLERNLGQFFLGGYVFNWSYDKDTQNGYFAPPNYLLYSGVIGWQGNITDFLRCRLSASLGEQKYQGDTDTAITYQSRCSTKISPNLEADFGYSYSNTQNQAGRNASNNQILTGQLRFTF